MAKRTARTLGILALATGLVATAMALGAAPARGNKVAEWPPPAPAAPPTAAPVPAPAPPVPAPPPPAPEFVAPSCGAAAPESASKTVGNPAARRAAQRGIAFLVRQAVAWQQQYACYGCHVQAVTVEALSVGVNHQYRVDRKAL